MQHPQTPPRRLSRPGRRENSSLVRQILRRCFPQTIFRRALQQRNSRPRRLLFCVLLSLIALLAVLLGVLLYHLFVEENDTIVDYLQSNNNNNNNNNNKADTVPSLTLESASPAEVQAIKDTLHPFVPRTKGPVPRIRQNGFLPTYFDLEDRLLPPLTKAALEGWFHAQTPLTDVSEEVLLRHASAEMNASAQFASTPTMAQEAQANDDLFQLLAFLYPPAQQQRYYRDALNAILGFGERVGGTQRDPLLRHLVHEGLGQATYDASRRTYRNPAHLSAKGVALLESVAAEWPEKPLFISSSASPAVGAGADRVPGWRWSLQWDNFTATIPLRVAGPSKATTAATNTAPSTVSLQNLIFQFPGGSQFRRKQAALQDPQAVFVGHEERPVTSLTEERANLFAEEYHSRDASGEVYTQETFLGPGKLVGEAFSIPELRRGEPGTRAEINTRGTRVPLKPSLTTRKALPVSRQPIQHAVYAAHWDSMHSPNFRFLAACDSAVPMVYLLRTMRNIAVLTDVAEVLAADYAHSNTSNTSGGPVIPGRTATFRASTTEAEVRARLATLLSPAHHALLYQYVFARPYGVGGSPPQPHDRDLPNYPRGLTVDVRMWLDWAQHLPALSLVLFDAEEAFLQWSGDDNTYGARHLAAKWRGIKTQVQTRYSGGPQSLFDSVDLFALYDLMGTAGTAFHNLFPTQSGIYYAALAQKETEMRQRAFADAATITAELLWRVLAGTAGEGTTTRSPADEQKANASATAGADLYVRQLGGSVDVAIAAIAQQHVTEVLASASARPSLQALPRSWLLYGAPREMLTLHRISLEEFYRTYRGLGALASLRDFDSLRPEVVAKAGFNNHRHLLTENGNIFFSPARVALSRRQLTDPKIADDHQHWLDTQRVLHLISYPFPKSWHHPSDDGSNIHDGTTVDLANVLWSTVLELGHYWTGENSTS